MGERERLVIATAYEWVGTPRADGQSSRVGCDCVGFIYGVGKQAGYVPAGDILPNYDQLARGDSLLTAMGRYLTPTNVPRQGLIVAMRYNKLTTHTGFLDWDNLKLIHCHYKQGVIAVPLTQTILNRVKENFFRLPDYPS
jgi:hypothetical protein